MYSSFLRLLSTPKWLLSVASLTKVKEKIKRGDPLSCSETKMMRKLHLLERCNRMISNFKTSKKCEGLTIAISVNGTMIWQKAFGVSDVENSYPATSDWKLNIASISKLFTTHLMMRYVEKNPEFLNKSLHDVIGNYPATVYIHLENQEPNIRWPWHRVADLVEYRFEENCPLPIFSLLSHTSGLTHYGNSLMLMSRKKFNSSTDAFNSNHWLWAYFVDYPATPIENGYGIKVHYTSYGINLIGVILERVQPLSYQNLLLNLCAELNLHHTNLCIFDEEIFDYKNGYTNELEDDSHSEIMLWGFARDLSIVYPSEGLVSNVGDLVKFGEQYAAMFTSSSRVGQLGQETVEKMFSAWSGLRYDEGFYGYGLGWTVNEWIKKIDSFNASDSCGPVPPRVSLCRRSAGHGGSSSGSQAYLLVSFCNQGERRLFELYPGADFVPHEIRQKQSQLHKKNVNLTPPDFRHEVLQENLNCAVKNFVRTSPTRLRNKIERLTEDLSAQLWPQFENQIRVINDKLQEDLESYHQEHLDRYWWLQGEFNAGRLDSETTQRELIQDRQEYDTACAALKEKCAEEEAAINEQFQEELARVKAEEEKKKRAALRRAEIRLQYQQEFDKELEARQLNGESPPMVFGTCEYDNNPELRDRPVLVKSEPNGNTVVVAAISNNFTVDVQDLCYDITRLFEAYYFDDNFVKTR